MAKTIEGAAEGSAARSREVDEDTWLRSANELQGDSGESRRVRLAVPTLRALPRTTDIPQAGSHGRARRMRERRWYQPPQIVELSAGGLERRARGDSDHSSRFARRHDSHVARQQLPVPHGHHN